MVAVAQRAATGKCSMNSSPHRGARRRRWWLEVSHVATLLAMVEAGLGVGIVPSMAIARRHPVLAAVSLADVKLQRRIGLLTLEGRRLTPVAERFYDHLKHRLVAQGASRRTLD